MQFLYYLILKPLSLLPWKVLYVFSDVLYFVVFRFFRYRQKVVTQNLTNAFPEKPLQEIKEIRDKFYRYFFDIMVESIKLFSASAEEIAQRMTITNPELFDHYFEQGRGVIITGGHYSNWEFVPYAVEPRIKHQTSAIYHQFKNQFVERKVLESRVKSGCWMVSRTAAQNGYYNKIKEPIVIIFATDQSPTVTRTVYWTKFLNQETAVAYGAEIFAKRKNSVVVWGDNRKVGRGRFELTFRVLTENPKDEPRGHITEMHTQALEEQILRKPEHWLWTHKRWKRKRKDSER